MLDITRLNALRSLVDPETAAAWLDEVESYRQRRGGKSASPPPPSTSVETLLTVKQLSERLNVTHNAVYEMVRRNEVPHVRIGRTIRFSWSRVLETLEGVG